MNITGDSVLWCASVDNLVTNAVNLMKHIGEFLGATERAKFTYVSAGKLLTHQTLATVKLIIHNYLVME